MGVKSRTVAFAVMGFLVGAVIGFALVFCIILFIGQSARRPFGEMAGVAAIDLGVFFGAPGGALLLGALGARLGARSRRQVGTGHEVPPQ
jgi:cell division protein FtsX